MPLYSRSEFDWRWNLFTFSTVVLFVLLYFGCTKIQPAGDDWLLIYPVRELMREHGFWSALWRIFQVPIWNFYRPLALLPMLLAGDSFLGVQLAKLVLMIGLYYSVIHLGRKLKLSVVWSILVGSLTLLHQTAVSAVTEVDLWADMVTALSLVWITERCISYCREEISRHRLIRDIGFLTAICLLSKEAGVVFFLLPALFALIRPCRVTSDTRRGLVMAAALSLTLTIAYLLARDLVGVRSTGEPDGYYSLRLGFNVIKNFGFALFGLFSPVETVRVALGGIGWKFLAAAWTVAFTLLMLPGLWRLRTRDEWRLPFFLLITFVLVQGPVWFMDHLTEANFLRSVAFGWLAFALCVSSYVGTHSARAIKSLTVFVAIAWFAFDLPAVHFKSRDIIAGQSVTARFRRELKSLFPVPQEKMLIAVLDPGYRGYSVYRWPLYQDIKHGDVPFGIQDLYAPETLQVDYVVVRSAEDALLQGATCLVENDGTVRRL